MVLLSIAKCFMIFVFLRDEKMDTATEPEGDKQDKAEEQNKEDTPAQSVSDQ